MNRGLLTGTKPMGMWIGALILLGATFGVPILAQEPATADVERPSEGVVTSLEALPLETMPIDDLERGQKGYGLSVFAGDEPERFDVEVIGVWRNSTPELSYLLARLSGQGLERSGVVGGMSGSPVFIDDKLVGAVAFSFSFGLDPIAGITPIGAMRRLAGSNANLHVPPVQPASAGGAAGPSTVQRTFSAPDWSPSIEQLVRQQFDPQTLVASLAVLQPPAPTSGLPAISWSSSGFTQHASELLQQQLGALSPPSIGSSVSPISTALINTSSIIGTQQATADVADDGWETDLQPGDAVALSLVRGDLSLAAHGTVTDRIGDSVLAFGHPIYSLGPVRLPMAAAEVVTVIPNVANSFKLSNAGPLIGTFDQDREPGAHGVLGDIPEMVPMSIALTGLEQRQYSVQLADAPLFKPTLIAVSALGALNAASHAAGDQGIDLRARLAIDGFDDLLLEQSFDGAQAAVNSVIYLLQFAAWLEFNDQRETTLTAIDIDLHQEARPRRLDLLSARADKTRLEPGETVDLRLELQPYRGPRELRTVQLEVPDDVPDGRYWVMIGDGTSMDAVRMEIEQRQPESFEQGLQMLRDMHSRRYLHLMGLVAAPGVSVDGAVLPDLPASMRSVFGEARTGTPIRLRIVDRQQLDLGAPVEGMVRVDLEIRRSRG